MNASGKLKTNGPYFPKGMGGVFILFHSADNRRPVQGVPFPAKWIHPENVIDNMEGSVQHQIPNLKSTE